MNSAEVERRCGADAVTQLAPRRPGGQFGKRFSFDDFRVSPHIRGDSEAWEK